MRAVGDAPAGFDARRDARSRRYEYRVLCGLPSALRRGRVLHHPTPLDVDAMNTAASVLVGRHDLRAFTPTRTEHVFFERTVTREVRRPRDDELVLTIEADAFLRHMVRVVAGTLMLVGRGLWTAERVHALTGRPARRSRPDGAGAPAHAGPRGLPGRLTPARASDRRFRQLRGRSGKASRPRPRSGSTGGRRRTRAVTVRHPGGQASAACHTLPQRRTPIR